MKFLPSKRSVLFLAIGFAALPALSGCLTSAKIDGWISEKYGMPPKKQKANDYMTVKMPGTTRGNAVSVTTKEKTKVIPALFYWRFHYANNSTLDPSVPFNNFNSALLSYAHSTGLKQKLNGQRLELSIDKMPTSFYYEDIDHGIFLLLYYIDWQIIFIEPKKQDITISYVLYKDSSVTKTGSISINDPNQRMYLKTFHYSGKKFVWRYLDQYDSNIQAMSKELIDKLIAEL